MDLAFQTRSCKVGVYSKLRQSGDWGCSSSSYSVDKALYRKTKYSTYEEGMYEKGYNSCTDYRAFDRHDQKERSFFDALKDTKDDQQDAYDDKNADTMGDSGDSEEH